MDTATGRPLQHFRINNSNDVFTVETNPHVDHDFIVWLNVKHKCPDAVKLVIRDNETGYSKTFENPCEEFMFKSDPNSVFKVFTGSENIENSSQVATSPSTNGGRADDPEERGHVKETRSSSLQAPTDEKAVEAFFDRILPKFFDPLNRGQQQIQSFLHQNHQETQESLATQKIMSQKISDGVDRLIRQTYELHENTIPRLFIVLEKNKPLDRATSPFRKQYRLFFLCECDGHTLVDEKSRDLNSGKPHEIHIAAHEGYDIDRPIQFFTKYGSHIVKVLKALKIAFMVASIAVPVLAHFDPGKGIDAVQNILDSSKGNLGPMIDDGIKATENVSDRHSYGAKGASSEMDVDERWILEGADLRQLESYLAIKDKSRTLGNLFRIVTDEGLVKWVCEYHYRLRHRESASQELRSIVRNNSGVLDERKGIIVCTWFTSPDEAEKFYRELKLSRAVQMADFGMGWSDLTTEHVQSLCTAATTSRLAGISISKAADYSSISGELSYRPILKLMDNGCLRSLKLVHFLDFFQRIKMKDIKGIQKDAQIRAFDIKTDRSLENDTNSNLLRSLLERCPMLTELTIEASKFNTIFQIVAGESKNLLEQLKTVTIWRLQSSVVVRLSPGKVETVEATVILSGGSAHSGTGFDDEDSLLTSGRLTKLNAKLRYKPGEEYRNVRNSLKKILRDNQHLSKVKVRCLASDIFVIEQVVSDTRDKFIKDRQQTALSTLEVYEDRDGSDHFNITMDLSTPKDPSNPLAPRISSIGCLPIQAFSKYGSSLSVLLEHAEKIDRLDTGAMFDDVLAQKVSNRIKENSDNLTSLTLHAKSLSKIGLDLMNGVIASCPGLRRFCLCLGDLQNKDQQENAVGLLRKHGDGVNSLNLSASLVETWNTDLQTLWDAGRRNFPNLDTLCLTRHHSSSPPSFGIESLAKSISVLQKKSTSATSSTSTRPPEQPVLKTVILENFDLLETEWYKVISELNFAFLETLSFAHTNFSEQEFAILISFLPSDDAPLRSIQLRGTRVPSANNSSDMKVYCSILKTKAPHVSVKW